MELRITKVDGKYIVSTTDTNYIHIDEVKLITGDLLSVLDIVKDFDYDAIETN